MLVEEQVVDGSTTTEVEAGEAFASLTLVGDEKNEEVGALPAHAHGDEELVSDDARDGSVDALASTDAELPGGLLPGGVLPHAEPSDAVPFDAVAHGAEPNVEEWSDRETLGCIEAERTSAEDGPPAPRNESALDTSTLTRADQGARASLSNYDADDSLTFGVGRGREDVTPEPTSASASPEWEVGEQGAFDLGATDDVIPSQASAVPAESEATGASWEPDENQLSLDASLEDVAADWVRPTGNEPLESYAVADALAADDTSGDPMYVASAINAESVAEVEAQVDADMAADMSVDMAVDAAAELPADVDADMAADVAADGALAAAPDVVPADAEFVIDDSAYAVDDSLVHPYVPEASGAPRDDSDRSCHAELTEAIGLGASPSEQPAVDAAAPEGASAEGKLGLASDAAASLEAPELVDAPRLLESVESLELAQPLAAAQPLHAAPPAEEPTLLDAELAGFALRPGESVREPAPIPGMEEMLAVAGAEANVEGTVAPLLAPGERELRDFVQRSEREAHVLSTLEMVARRVRAGEIVPSVDAGASAEAVLASVLASILSSRT